MNQEFPPCCVKVIDQCRNNLHHNSKPFLFKNKGKNKKNKNKKDYRLKNVTALIVDDEKVRAPSL